MAIHPDGSLIENSFCSSREAAHFAGPSELEKEVTALFDKMRSSLHRYLSSFGISREDSEEVIQEVFLSLFLHLQAGKPRTNLPGWIFRVAHNLGLKRQLASRRMVRAMASSADGQIMPQLDPSPDPEEQMSIAQRRERLLAIVEALPEQDRRCLYLRAEGLRYREIAKVVGISLGGVAVSLARALSRLANVDRR